MYLSFSIPIRCADASFIWTANNFLGSSRVLLDMTFEVFSSILFQNRSPVTSAVF